MIAFDYRDCGPYGEPRVVHVDQEVGYRVTVLAPDFVSFIEALRPESEGVNKGPYFDRAVVDAMNAANAAW